MKSAVCLPTHIIDNKLPIETLLADEFSTEAAAVNEQ